MRRSRSFVAALILAALIPAAAPGQLSKMSTSSFIEGLREEGMRELLMHLVATREFEDPVLRKQVKISELLLAYSEQYNRAMEQGKASLRQKAIADFEKALDTWRSLIEKHKDRVQRPIWQTNFSEQLLYEYLQTIQRSAPAFVEFGVSTVEQQKAFASASTEALGHLTQAYFELRRLEGKLPQRDDFKEKFQNTGLWDRLTNRYLNLKTPFFLAKAAHFVTQLENKHPYYQNLGEHERIPNQADTPKAERERLWKQTIKRLERFRGKGPDRYGVRANALSLTARAQLGLGKTEKALETLKKAREAAAGDKNLRHLKIELARAKALAQKGDLAAGIELAAGLKDHPQAKKNLLYRVLVVDAEHRLRLRRARSGKAENKDEAIAAAYEPYMNLLAELEGSSRGQAIKRFIYRRWEARVGDKKDLSAVPPVVVLAMGEQARKQGQRYAAQAYQARQQGKKEKAKKLAEKARPKLKRAKRVLGDLLEREGLGKDVRAEATYNLGMAQYFTDPASTDQQLKAADTMLGLAKKLPEHPVTERAVKTAVGQILRPLHQGAGGEKVTKAYEKGVKRLLEIAPDSSTAHNQRLYYAVNLLMPADRWQRAADVLSDVPIGHRDYFLARGGVLEAMVQRLPEAEDPKSLADRIYEEAQALLEMTRNKRGDVSGEQRSDLNYAAGRALIALAKIEARRGEVERALDRLKGFAQRFSEHEGLVQEALEQRVMVLIEGERYGDAADQAQGMMEQFPDRAANFTDRVLTLMEERIRRLRRQANETLVERKKKELRAKAQKIAKAAVDVANALVDWANRQDFSREEMAPYRLALGSALRIAGRLDDAINVLRPLRDVLPNNADLLHNLAEAYFHKAREAGNEKMLIEKAAPLYDKLIGGLQPNDKGNYPDEYWNAWRRRLRISDIVGQGTDEIPLRVRQLERTNQNLGGEPYKSDLIELKLKYSD